MCTCGRKILYFVWAASLETERDPTTIIESGSLSRPFLIKKELNAVQRQCLDGHRFTIIIKGGCYVPGKLVVRESCFLGLDSPKMQDNPQMYTVLQSRDKFVY